MKIAVHSPFLSNCEWFIIKNKIKTVSLAQVYLVSFPSYLIPTNLEYYMKIHTFLVYISCSKYEYINQKKTRIVFTSVASILFLSFDFPSSLFSFNLRNVRIHYGTLLRLSEIIFLTHSLNTFSNGDLRWSLHN